MNISVKFVEKLNAVDVNRHNGDQTLLAINQREMSVNNVLRYLIKTYKKEIKNMSQWTHVLGTIRFDYYAQVIWSSDTDGRPKCYDIQKKIKKLKNIFNKDVPRGSEGPLEIKVINSERGPIVTISGDLRDFGSQNDIKSIINWLDKSIDKIEKYNQNYQFEDHLDIRDSIISINVEFSQKLIVLVFNENKSKWSQYKISKPRE